MRKTCARLKVFAHIIFVPAVLLDSGPATPSKIMNPNDPHVSRALGRLSSHYGSKATIEEYFAMARRAVDMEDLRRLMAEHLQVEVKYICELPFSM